MVSPGLLGRKLYESGNSKVGDMDTECIVNSAKEDFHKNVKVASGTDLIFVGLY